MAIEDLANCHPKLRRGQVWCHECGRTQKVNSGHALANGWPKCCGYTMSIDSPEERAHFKQVLAAEESDPLRMVVFSSRSDA
ncbi:MAG: hypothetical protein KZQ94_15875 [Candidatus Thiodiazotropha sp. (ex Troendleina suluensis)]|nr:hypothetical protein [Candidatus Thiodiazotropha sp. (ex Troendleina suluensis)]